MGRYEEALQSLNKAIELNNQKALPYLEQYINAYPEDTDGLWYLVYIHESLGEYSDALPYVDKVIELDLEQQLNALDYKGFLLTYAGGFKEG